MAGLSTVDMEVTGLVDMVGQGTAMVRTVDTECLPWEDMVVTGHLMAATVAAQIIRLFHPQLQRREFLKDCSAGTVVHLSTGLGISVVDVARLFSDLRVKIFYSGDPAEPVYDLILM